jgi:hypothetical protein
MRRGIERILRSFVSQLDRSRQNAAWVSGFFGSGKSHLLKVLGHLFVDTRFPDGATARTLVQRKPGAVSDLLREVDTHVKRSRKPALIASGAMPQGTTEQVRLTVLSFVFEACGLPPHYAQAQFCIWLRERGLIERVRHEVESSGRVWLKEINNLYVSGGLISKLLLSIDPAFARDEIEARRILLERFSKPVADLGTSDFLAAFRDAVAPDGELPLMLLVLDEVQQYIADSNERSTIFTDLSEAIQTQLGSRVMLVASGQSALSEKTSNLMKLRDRFRVTVQLLDSDIEAVTRRVLLAKKPDADGAIRAVLDRNAGEVSKHLQGTRLAERSEDAKIRVADYPLLPTRRRFWEECFRVVDPTGTHSQLRSQLRVLADMLLRAAECPLGYAIPADQLFGEFSDHLVNTGVLLHELATRIKLLNDGTEKGQLRHRIAGLVFLINRLPREAPADTGIRAHARWIADLMVDDLEADSGPLRKTIEEALEGLVADGTLMKLGEEYRLQTTEGAEWDRSQRERVGTLRNQEGELAIKRDQRFASEVQKLVQDRRFVHGEAKVSRDIELHLGSSAPSSEVLTRGIVVWLRDGWSSSLKDVETEARRRGLDDPVVHVFLPKKHVDELKSTMLEADAAQWVLESKGIPSTDPGREARESMLSRCRAAEQQRNGYVKEIVEGARVLVGGGTEQFDDTLPKKLEAAKQIALARAYPRFAECDHRLWDAALKNALDGNDKPLLKVGWERANEEHPIAREILSRVTTGARGSELRKALMAAPFGWPKEAIDAVLVALLNSSTLRATLNGQPATREQLDSTKIGVTEFRLEKVRIGAPDRIALRGLFQTAGVGAKSGEEELKARAFLDRLGQLAQEAGGDAPMPERPNRAKLDELNRLEGSELLGALLVEREKLAAWATDWQATANRLRERRPAWELLTRLLEHGHSLPEAAEIERQSEAIRSSRALLADPDPVAPLQTRMATALRGALTARADEHRSAFAAAMVVLDADAGWSRLDSRVRSEVLAASGLIAPPALSMKTDEELLLELDRAGLSARTDAIAAVKDRVTRALEEAARRSKPTARRIALRAATLETEVDVEAWIDEQATKLREAIGDGPVIVG